MYVLSKAIIIIIIIIHHVCVCLYVLFFQSYEGIVSIPQSSFDTGHAVLGTKISKGTLAHRLCRLQVMFNITGK